MFMVKEIMAEVSGHLINECQLVDFHGSQQHNTWPEETHWLELERYSSKD